MPTPWASKDYCDYSKHVYCLYGSAVCFSSTPQQRQLFCRANGTAASHRQLAAASRPVSGLAARSGLAGTRQSRAVQSCGGAEQGNTQGSRAESRPPRTTAQRACVHACTAPVFSLYLFQLPFFRTPSQSSHESFHPSSFSLAPSHPHVPIVTAQPVH